MSDKALSTVDTLNHEHSESEPPKTSGKNAKQVFAGGLNKTITKGDLQQAFSTFGKVALVRIMTKVNGGGRGFAFIRFQAVKSAQAAVMKRTVQVGSTLVQIKACVDVQTSCNLKEHKAASKIFIGGVSPRLQKEELRMYLSKFGEVQELNIVTDPDTGKSKGYCFCVFANQDSADSIIATATHHTIKGFKLKISRAVHKDEEISFGNLDFTSPFSETRLLYCASLNHEADNVRLNVGPGWGWLVSASPASAHSIPPI